MSATAARSLPALTLCAIALAACSDRPQPAGAPGAPLDPNDPKALLAAVDRMQGDMKDQPKSFEVLSALGNLYYENGRYLEAIDTLRQALARAQPVEVEAQKLRLNGTKPAKELPLECRRTPTFGLEQIAVQAAKRAAGDAAGALRCYDEALSSVLTARQRRANALYLIGQPEVALVEQRRVLEKEPNNPEALFFVGAILLEKSGGEDKKLEEGRKYWKKLVEVAPGHPRAALAKESLPKLKELFTPKATPAPVAAGSALPPGHPPTDGPIRQAPPLAPGQTELPPNHPPMDAAPSPAGAPAAVGGNAPGAPMAHSGATSAELAAGQPSPEALKAIEDAVNQTERTPEVEKGLDDLVAQGEADLDAGRAAEARSKFVRVMPMRPNDARVAAGMGGAVRALGRAEMAERVLTRALELDPKNPRALLELSRIDAARGDKAAARKKLEQVLAQSPAWAKPRGVAAELAKLK